MVHYMIRTLMICPFTPLPLLGRHPRSTVQDLRADYWSPTLRLALNVILSVTIVMVIRCNFYSYPLIFTIPPLPPINQSS
jgi:hypothetical protein